MQPIRIKQIFSVFMLFIIADLASASSCIYPKPTANLPADPSSPYDVSIGEVGIFDVEGNLGYEYAPSESMLPFAKPISLGASRPKTRLGYFVSPCNDPNQITALDGDDVDPNQYGGVEKIDRKGKGVPAPSVPGRYVLTVCANYNESFQASVTENNVENNCNYAEFVVLGGKVAKKFSSSKKVSKHHKSKRSAKKKDKCKKNGKCSAANTKAKGKNKKKHKGDPVDISTGAQVIDLTLLEVQGVLPISFDLSYNSLLLEEGKAGVGWSLDGLESWLEIVDANNITVHWSENAQNEYIKGADGIYRGDVPETQLDTLVQNADGTFSLNAKDEEITYLFDSAGTLSKLIDRESHALLFEYVNKRVAKITEPVSGVFLSFNYNADGFVETVTDSINRQIKLEYDADHRLVGIIDANGNRFTYTYNDFGQVLSGTTYEGIVLFKNEYDPQEGRVISQDDNIDTNQKLIFSYDYSQADKIVTTVTDRKGITSVYTYNQNYQPLIIKNELGVQTEAVSYNANGTVASATDANNNTYLAVYDNNGNPTSVTNPKGQITTSEFDANNNVLWVENALKKRMNFGYLNNKMVSATDPLNQTYLLEYDSNGLPSKITTPSGKVTQITRQWTSAGLIEQIIDPENNIEENQYDKAGRLIAQIDANGRKIMLVYDNLNRVVEILLPLNRKLSMSYDSRDNPIKIVDSKGNITQLFYDGNGNLIKTINALNQESRREYDEEDRLIKIIDSKGASTEILRDAAGRVTGIKNALGNVFQVKLDNLGNILEQQDAIGQVISRVVYDALNNPISITNALGYSKQLKYNEVNDVTEIMDEVNRSTQLNYDELSRVKSTADALKGISEQSFDSDGLLSSFKDPNKHQTSFGYNKAGQVISEQTATGKKVNYQFKADDLKKKINARGQAIDFEYDQAGRIIALITPEDKILITYDANDNVLTLSGKMGTVSYEYDALDRPIRYTDIDNNVIKIEYDELGNRKKLVYPDGKVVNYEHSAIGQLVKVTDWAGRITQYIYNANGQLEKTIYSNQIIETRIYNEAGQLVNVQLINGSGKILRVVEMNYLPTGEIELENVTPSLEEIIPAASTAMGYGAANQMLYQNNQATHFDEDGNMTGAILNGKPAQFSFDSQNKLAQANSDSYTYSPDDLRIAITHDNQTTKYVIDPIQELSQTLVRIKSDGTKTNYVYGLGLIGEETNGVYRNYHFDLRGSTVALTDQNAQIIGEVHYNNYGQIIKQTNNIDTPFLFNGEYGVMTDPNGLYYMRARYYSPELKRFINQDVLLGDLSNSQSLNRYAFVEGNPISYIDPFGLETTVIIVYDSTMGIEYGTHSALIINEGIPSVKTKQGEILGVKGPVLFDPSGGFYESLSNGKELINPGEYYSMSELGFTLEDFKKYHTDVGEKVVTFTFDTTQKQERKIAKRIAKHKFNSTVHCAKEVTEALRGIRPFKKLKLETYFDIMFPGNLAEQIRNIK